MKQITQSLYQISLGTVNAFVIENNGLTLIDTGLKGSTEKIFSAIKKAGKKPEDIKQIILTHCHPDHAGNAAELKKLFNVPVFAHETDAPLIEQGIGGRQMHLTPGVVHWLIYNLFIKKAGNTIAPVTVDEKLKDNDVLPIAGGIQVIHTPGHSAGHIALLLKDEGVLIAADICANAVGVDYSTLYEDINLGRKSILKAAGFSFDKAVFGHGNLLKDGANEKMKAKFNKAL
ncbi:MAG: MBL fold metallo-hydrolase [Mucilaginibacter sp.]|uniref:MBL fold metallo-hydrolase n=1 Tax=Mucilaginibacter sp. TaxID=1882438 RepID=UPI0034E57267